MSRLKLKPDYRSPSRITLRLTSPWEESETVLLRLPEAISHAKGHLFCEWNRKDAWPDAKPRRLPEWECAEDGVTLVYTCALQNDVAFGVRVTPGRDMLDLALWVENASSEPLTQISANMCVVLSQAPEFCDRSLKRTYFLHAGRPRAFSTTSPEPASMKRPPWIHCQVRGIAPFDVPADCPWWICRERADDGLVFTESCESGRHLALIWGRALSIVANSTAPCIHSNPRLNDCAPGERVEQRGRLLLNEGKVDLLCSRALDGFE